MVSKTKAEQAEAPAQGSQYDELESQFLSDDYGKREPLKAICEVVELYVTVAPEEWMDRRQLPFNSPQWQALFPDGYPVLLLGRRGVDVEFAYSPDGIDRRYIPLKHELGKPNEGDLRGRGSEIFVFREACKKVFGVYPFGVDNQQRILNAGPAQWTQYLGEMAATGSDPERTWAWPIPERLMEPGFQFTGEVRKIQGRAQQDTAPGAGGTVGAGTQLSEEDSLKAVAAALNGMAADDQAGHQEAVLNLTGLTQKWYAAGADGNPALLAAEAGAVTESEDGTKIVLVEGFEV